MECRWYQSEAVESAWGHLRSQAGEPIIVLPTGAGKSIVIAKLCLDAVNWNGRVMVLQHRSELIRQNAEKAFVFLPKGISVGINSAGIGQRDYDSQVVFAGIQSVFRDAHKFGERNLIIVDEVHLCPRDGEGMYRTFFESMKSINPRHRRIGLTATPYRTGEGALCRADGLFQKICYSAEIQRLIADGYLCRVTNTAAECTVNTDSLHVRGGEFIANEVESLFSGNVRQACREIVEKCYGRKSVLVFCAGVSHAAKVAETIEEISGERCRVITGETPQLERTAYIDDFRSQSLKYLCNVDVLTTGFDAPCVDAIAILRATCSPGLFAQICGRGFRIHPTKESCLLLDFGENLKRHGPVDAIDFGQDKTAARMNGGDTPFKKCPNCECESLIQARECLECGFEFPRENKPRHGESADLDSQVMAAPVTFRVEAVGLSRHRKKKAAEGAPDTLRVDYEVYPVDSDGNLKREVISEWVCLEHAGFAGTKAIAWWKERSAADLNDSEYASWIDAAIDLWGRGAMRQPVAITAIRDGRFWRITSAKFDEDRPADWRSMAEVEGEELPF